MSLRLQFSLLLLGFLIVLGVNLIVAEVNGSAVARDLALQEKILYPSSVLAENMLGYFEKVDNLFELAVLTGESSLLETNRAEQTAFATAASRLENLAGKTTREATEKVREQFSAYFKAAEALTLAMIAGESNDYDNQETVQQLARQTSELRNTLSSSLEQLVAETAQSLGAALEETAARSRNLARLMLLLNLAALAGASIILYFIYRAIVRPIEKLSDATRQIGSGSFSAGHLEAAGGGEIGNLARAFAAMGRRLRQTTVSRDSFDTIIRTIADMVLVIEPDLSIRLANEAAAQHLGYSRTELEALSAKALFPAGSLDDSPMAQGDIGVAFDHEEMYLLHRHGRHIPVLFSATAMLADSGGLDGYVCIATDITERKRAEQAMRQAEEAARREQLLQADKMESLSILVSGVAHEVNNPNHVIASNVFLLQKAWESARPVLAQYAEEHGQLHLGGLPWERAREQVPQTISLIKGASQRIRTIVKELRDYAMRKPEEEHQELNLGDVARSAAVLLGNLISRATQNFTVQVEPDLPPVHGNYQRLEQVVINLLNNAVQALADADGRILMRVYSQGPTCILAVEDTGLGMDEETIRHSTDPFFTTRRESGGTGLGLSISNSIIEEHSGTLQIESSPGVGTTVRILVPAYDRTMEAEHV